MTTLEARNVRTGRVVCTFEDPAKAFAFCLARTDLGVLEVWKITRTIKEERLVPATVTQLRAGRGR